MDTLISIGMWIFMYCTDFMINAANLTSTSYYEVNAMVFVVVWPLLTVVLLGYYLVLQWRVRKQESCSQIKDSYPLH